MSTHNMNKGKTSVLRMYVGVGATIFFPLFQIWICFSTPMLLFVCCLVKIYEFRSGFCLLPHSIALAFLCYWLIDVCSCILATPIVIFCCSSTVGSCSCLLTTPIVTFFCSSLMESCVATLASSPLTYLDRLSTLASVTSANPAHPTCG